MTSVTHWLFRALRAVTPPVIVWLLRRRRSVPAGLSIAYRVADDAEAARLREAANRGYHPDVETGTENWSGLVHVQAVVQFIESEIAPRVPSEAHVLDVGCGAGGYGPLLRRPGSPTEHWAYGGVEQSQQACARAHALNTDGTFISTEGGTTIPLGDRSCDVVMSNGVIQYVDDYETLLREIARVSSRLVYISRLPVVRDHPTVWCAQTVRLDGAESVDLFRILSRAEFESMAAQTGLETITRDWSPEIYTVEGIPEPVVLAQYLFRRA